MSEAVNHPKHYNSGKIEVIEFIEDQGHGEGFCLGSAIKYLSRAGKKDPTKEIEDLEKAIWYIKRRVEILKATKESREVNRPNAMNPQVPSSLTEHTAKLIEELKTKGSSATDALTSSPRLPEPTTATVSDANDDDVSFTLHGTWHWIAPEGQDETAAFIPDARMPHEPKDSLNWLSGESCAGCFHLDPSALNKISAEEEHA